MKNIFKKIFEVKTKGGHFLSESFRTYRKPSGVYELWDGDKELNESIRNRMNKIVYEMHLKNPMAKRIIEITRDFAIGDGLKYECDDDNVKEILDKFWNNPLNNMDIEIRRLAYDLGLWGEIVIKVDVNPINGFVTLSYLDPTKIKDVLVRKNNNKDIDSIIFMEDDYIMEKSYKVIKENEEGLLEGDVFYYRVNNLTNQIRGLSDLLPLIDWLDALDKFLFNTIERSALLNSFIYQIQWIGMNKDDIAEQARKFGSIKPGSIHHTNENVKINAITPDLKANDLSEIFRVLRNFVLGCAGFPEHWFGEGGYANLSTAKEMGQPTYQKIKERQTLILKIISDILKFQVDQAEICGRLIFKQEKKPVITIRSMDVKSTGKTDFPESLAKLAEFVEKSVKGGLIDIETGKNIIKSTLELNGFKYVI
jgi:hypothetical protein